MVITQTAEELTKRRLRAGEEKNEIVHLLRLADRLGVVSLNGIDPDAVAELGKKSIAREVARARRYIFKSLFEQLDVYRDTNYRERLVEDLLVAIKAEYSDWETPFARSVIGPAREQFDASINNKPVELVTGPQETKPQCSSCLAVKAQDKRLDFEKFEILPLCWDCAKDQQQRYVHAA
jgi:hypothetical protein